MTRALLVDLTTGEAVEYPTGREAAAMCEALNRDGHRLRHDRPRGEQGPPRRMTYPLGNPPLKARSDVLEMVNLRRAEHGLAPFASLRPVRQL